MISDGLTGYFNWDDANVGHIARHRVLPFEAEEVILSWPILVEERTVDGDEIRSEVGETRRGRILLVASTERDGRVRVVTAFDAIALHKKAWLREQSRRAL